MRIAIFSHGHPNFSKGGAEIASHNLYKGINETAEHEAWFVSHGDDDLMHQGTTVAAISERQYFLRGNAGIDHLSSTIPLGSDSDFADMLRAIKPDVIHFHHYIKFGVETILAAKKICPSAKIILTLHEFIAICNNLGQMVKTDGRLCYKYSPLDCHKCLPNKTPEDFFLRERFIKVFFNRVDLFICPSEFLKARYSDWGLCDKQIKVVENGLAISEPENPRILNKNEKRGKFAYFGQIHKHKGLNIILEAFSSLPKKTSKHTSLSIYGDYSHSQNDPIVNQIKQLSEDEMSNVNYYGPYEQRELGQLMAGVDWVIMGSTWWENSPIVIQESFKYGRPIIVPDIGGMAEKVIPGIGGLNYRARDSLSLASILRRIVDEPELFDSVHRTIPAYPKIDEIVEKHIKLYKELD